MSLRQEVFVVEQNCPYIDADGSDQQSYHVLGEYDNQLVSYARVCPPGVSYKDHVSIGRVIVKHNMRSSGEGYRLMNYTLERCGELFPKFSNKISAQQHLQKFYSNLGYKPIGKGYLEDGIPHIAMIRS